MKYYNVFSDETLHEAIGNHDHGFDSIEDAVDDANTLEEGMEFKVINSRHEVVHVGVTGYRDGKGK